MAILFNHGPRNFFKQTASRRKFLSGNYRRAMSIRRFFEMIFEKDCCSISPAVLKLTFLLSQQARPKTFQP